MNVTILCFVDLDETERSLGDSEYATPFTGREIPGRWLQSAGPGLNFVPRW